MKKFLGVLIINLFIINSSLGDDIRDIQIEGISIGDNAIDFFSEDLLKKSTSKISGTDNKFSFAAIYDKRFGEYINISNFNFEIFDAVEVYFLSSDKNYKIYALSGALTKNIGKKFKTEKECIKKKEKIYLDIKPIFKNAEAVNDSSWAPLDKAKKSKFYRTFLRLTPNSKYYEVEVSCIFYKGEISKTYESNVGITLMSDEFNDWKSKQKLFNQQ